MKKDPATSSAWAVSGPFRTTSPRELHELASGQRDVVAARRDHLRNAHLAHFATAVSEQDLTHELMVGRDGQLLERRRAGGLLIEDQASAPQRLDEPLAIDLGDHYLDAAAAVLHAQCARLDAQLDSDPLAQLTWDAGVVVSQWAVAVDVHNPLMVVARLAIGDLRPLALPDTRRIHGGKSAIQARAANVVRVAAASGGYLAGEGGCGSWSPA